MENGQGAGNCQAGPDPSQLGPSSIHSDWSVLILRRETREKSISALHSVERHVRLQLGNYISCMGASQGHNFLQPVLPGFQKKSLHCFCRPWTEMLVLRSVDSGDSGPR